MRYALVGHGRMGRAIDRVATKREHVGAGRFDSRSNPLRGDALREIDVAFEFTAPRAAEDNVVALLEAGVPVVCGTTGWQAGDRVRVALESGRAGIVLADSYSIGMQLFLRIVRHASALVARADLHAPFIEEAHHAGKRDAPSGTAIRLSQIVLETDPRIDTVVEGNPADRLPPGALHVSSRRAGHEPGTHVVGFDGPHDLLRLEHRARDRDAFALGAVVAAEWLGRRRGFYRFEEIVDEMLVVSGEARSPNREIE